MAIIGNSDWHVIGLVDIREPGRYEILFKNGGIGVGIRFLDAPAQEPMVVDDDGVAHPCRICTCCGNCACGYGYGGRTRCRDCGEYSSWVARNARYLSATSPP